MDKNILLALEIMCSGSYSMMSISNTELCFVMSGDDQIIISKTAYQKLDQMKSLYQDIVFDNNKLISRLTQ